MLYCQKIDLLVLKRRIRCLGKANRRFNFRNINTVESQNSGVVPFVKLNFIALSELGQGIF